MVSPTGVKKIRRADAVLKLRSSCGCPANQSEAGDRSTPHRTGPTGLKMTGPYEWVPPNYWLLDTKNGGAYGFNTETSPGPAVPPLASAPSVVPSSQSDGASLTILTSDSTTST